MTARAAREGVACHFPPPRFCTDNAAMVAGLGYHLYKAGRIADLHLDVVATKAHKA
jgi:N6-L-threonylcarbamoyladenine synthase